MTPSRSSRRGRWRHRIATATAEVVLTVSACSAPTPSFGEHDHGAGIPAGASIRPLPPLPAPWTSLDRADPAAMAIAAIQAVFDWRPERGEPGPEIAAQRAAPLFTQRAAAQYQPYPIPRPTWQEWMDEHAKITAATTISTEEHPADTGVSWRRKAATTLTITASGKVPATLTVVSLVTEQKQPQWTITTLVHLE
jgi:hypothetical protein